MTVSAATTPPSTMRRDVVSAYVATAARVGSWAVVAAVVMRQFGTDEFALLALIRGTLSILNYGTLGLGPAMIQHLSRGSDSVERAQPAAVLPLELPQNVAAPAAALAYANPTELADPLHNVLRPLRETYAAGLAVTLVAAVVSVALVFAYTANFEVVHHLPRAWTRIWGLREFVLYMGLGAVCRVASEAPAAVLQVRDRITRDNLYQAGAECVWVAGMLAVSLQPWPSLPDVGSWFMISGAFLLVARLMTAATISQRFVFELPRPPRGAARTLLATSMVIVLGQLANYLYAPAAMIIINRMLDAELVAYYDAAVQVDAALLLLVSSVATVLLPKAAVAHAADDVAAIRRYYVRGTLGSFSLLALAAVIAVAAAPWVYPLWLGEEMRTTRAILPILLISTVVGGSGMVGRSILIGMGKAQAFTGAALTAGIAHVGLAAALVQLGYGLRGIVCATAIVVIARAGIWQPLYVLSTLRRPPSPRN